MKRASRSAFTLIELLTVLAVIGVLASLVVSIGPGAHAKAARLRAQGEIRMLGMAAEAYQSDFGVYPRNADSDRLDPRLEGFPNTPAYRKANLFLYQTLTGNPSTGQRSYCLPAPGMLKKDASGVVLGMQDPFGNFYGYSTAGAANEEAFAARLQDDASSVRSAQRGFGPRFDLWSTAGILTSDAAHVGEAQQRWVKSW